MVLLCTQQLRQYRFCPSWYFCTFSLHHEYCFWFPFPLKEISFELLAGVCFFTCVKDLHIMGDHHLMNKGLQESWLRKTLSGCVIRMRFCTKPPPGHHPQPDREAWNFSSSKVDLEKNKLCEPEMPGKSSNNRLLTGHQGLTWFRMADLQLGMLHL